MKLRDTKRGEIVKVGNGIKYEVIKPDYPTTFVRGIDGRTNNKVKGFGGNTDCEVVK
jgi:hypothetical protein